MPQCVPLELYRKMAPMRFRKLRIVWSVFWGIACVLLIALWVRSYWFSDTIRTPNGWTYSSSRGGVAVGVNYLVADNGVLRPIKEWIYSSAKTDYQYSLHESYLGFYHHLEPPYWNTYGLPFSLPVSIA